MSEYISYPTRCSPSLPSSLARIAFSVAIGSSTENGGGQPARVEWDLTAALRQRYRLVAWPARGAWPGAFAGALNLRRAFSGVCHADR